MKKKLLLIIKLLLLFNFIYAQTSDTIKDEKIKTGFSFGGVPAVAYNSDTGFKYGLILNFYHYGDGSRYPNYNHSLYLEWSRTTKGSGIWQAIYETQTLIPKTRMMLEGSYFTEQALDFYGFNGYEAYFNSDFSDDSSPYYISRMYYRKARKFLSLKAEFQGTIGNSNFRWLAGFTHSNFNIGSVDLEKLNKGQDADKILPDTATLYDKYVEWGVIKENQKTGGSINAFTLGLVYDSRDNEANPNRGVWSEALILNAPGFLANENGYTRLMLSHRQYFTLIKNRLTFAYRMSYQSKIAGEMPYYMMPRTVDSKSTKDGLGGSKNLRGILRNRIVGEGFVFTNLEFRWKFLKTIIWNQNFYIALNTFIDGGMVTNKYKFDTSGVTASYGNTIEENLETITKNKETVHLSYGAGLHFAINENFIIAVDYGRAVNKQDGKSGLYIALNFLF